MEWVDEGIILGVRRHGESSVITEVMTRHHGRHMGLVRSGRSRSMQPVLQPGNSVDLVWRARLDEHLGSFQLEPVKMRAAQLMETAVSVHGIQAMAALLRLLPERDPHENMYNMFSVMVEHLDQAADAGELFIRFEIAMLDELGFGLDLTQCAATGVRDDLIYISPKSGRAVCAEAGKPWADKMFSLPEFLQNGTGNGAGLAANKTSLEDAFKVTQFFLDRHIYGPRGIDIPLSRNGFIQAVLKQCPM